MLIKKFTPIVKKFTPRCTSLDGSLAIRYTAVRRGVAQLVAHRVWDAGVVGSNPITPTTGCGSSAMVAHLPSKQMVAGSSPVSRSSFAS